MNAHGESTTNSLPASWTVADLPRDAFVEGRRIPAVLAADGRFQTLLGLLKLNSLFQLALIGGARFDHSFLATTDEAFAQLRTGWNRILSMRYEAGVSSTGTSLAGLPNPQPISSPTSDRPTVSFAWLRMPATCFSALAMAMFYRWGSVPWVAMSVGLLE